MEERESSSVQSVETGFEIVEAVRTLDGAGVADISEALEMPKSTVYNHLHTLERAEFVTKSGTEYDIGLRFLDYGGHARSKEELYELARPAVDDLADTTGAAANLMVEDDGVGVYLYHCRGDGPIRIDPHVGQRTPLHATALGKAILAHLPDGYAGSLLEADALPEYTPRTTTERGELREELQTVREEGIAFDDQSRHQGLRCVAAPILDERDRVLGAISVSGPVNEFDGERFRSELPARVEDAANAVRLKLTRA